MGYSTLKSQALSAPPYLLSFFLVLLTAHLSDRLRTRSPFIIAHSLLAASGYLLITLAGLFDWGITWRYLGVYPASAGFFSAVTLIITWTINNQPSDSKKGAGLAMLNIIGQCGPLVGTRLYPNEDKPLFLKGMSVCAAFMVFVALLAGGMRWKRKDGVRISPMMKREYRPLPSPLIMIAAHQNDAAMIGLLLKHGYQVDARDGFGMTALHVVSGHGNVSAIRAPLARGCTQSPDKKYNRRPSHHAIQGGHLGAARLLLECGAPMWEKRERGERSSAIPMTISDGNVAMLRILLQKDLYSPPLPQSAEIDRYSDVFINIVAQAFYLRRKCIIGLLMDHSREIVDIIGPERTVVDVARQVIIIGSCRNVEISDQGHAQRRQTGQTENQDERGRYYPCEYTYHMSSKSGSRTCQPGP
ncbi:MAG: hypothetical protein M1816_007690 [Peltula sp. TS41687]|nr:MAG: hypothetical protein M1816_007690 [Peltula sp. TS41687]